jgi:uncharacterized protein (TIGR03435 family)
MMRAVPLLLLAAAALAQTGGFDVASIKPSDPSSHGMHMGISAGGSFEASGVTLMTLIQQAYDVRGFQISGGAGWMTTDRYDIVTKNERGGPAEADLVKMSDAQRSEFQAVMMARLRVLLEDRFQLKTHRETKEMAVFGLVVEKGGPKMQISGAAQSESSLSVSRGDEATMRVRGKGLPMANLARYLSDQAGRQVIDETGLSGKYDFEFAFAPDLGEIAGPSLFTAIQQELGLRLESKKGSVEAVAIDSAQKPSEN